MGFIFFFTFLYYLDFWQDDLVLLNLLGAKKKANIMIIFRQQQVGWEIGWRIPEAGQREEPAGRTGCKIVGSACESRCDPIVRSPGQGSNRSEPQ